MEAATLSSGRKQIWEDRYQWVLILALAALMAELFLPSTPKTALVSVLLWALIFSPYTVLASGVHRSMQKGQEAYQKQDYEAALKSFIDAQLEDPDRPEIFYNIANAYYKLGDFDSAFENYSQALAGEKNSLKQKVLYNRGNANYRRGRLEDAISDYEAALKIDAGDQEAAQNLDYVKKMLEMKKEQQHQRSSQGKEKSEEQEKSSPKKEEHRGETPEKAAGRRQEDNDVGGPSPEYGQSTDAKPDDDSRQQTPSPEREKPADDPGTAAVQASPAPDRHQMKQAERMLNRLRDMPGKALMPVYRQRKVEKDW